MTRTFGTGKKVVDLKEFVNSIDEAALCSQIFDIIPPAVINAPYRKDNNASLSIYYNSSNRVRFKDFGTGESGSLIDLISKCWNTNFKDTVERIVNNYKDIKLSSTKRTSHTKHFVSTSDIQVKIRKWEQYDLDYWESYGISLEWLKFGDIFPISRIFFTNSFNETSVFPAEKYAYCYVERKDGKVTLKIYQPFSTTHKWMNKHNSSIWDLWTKIPEKGEKLIITSSRKDALCVWENTGIPCVSLQGEGYIPKKHVVEQLKHRFNKIYVLYDNDFASESNHGRIDGEKIAKTFDLIQIELPEELQCKDPSDLVKMHGRECLFNTIKKLIDDTQNN